MKEETNLYRICYCNLLVFCSQMSYTSKVWDINLNVPSILFFLKIKLNFGLYHDKNKY